MSRLGIFVNDLPTVKTCYWKMETAFSVSFGLFIESIEMCNAVNAP